MPDWISCKVRVLSGLPELDEELLEEELLEEELLDDELLDDELLDDELLELDDPVGFSDVPPQAPSANTTAPNKGNHFIRTPSRSFYC